MYGDLADAALAGLAAALGGDDGGDASGDGGLAVAHALAVDLVPLLPDGIVSLRHLSPASSPRPQPPPRAPPPDLGGPDYSPLQLRLSSISTKT